MAAELPDTDSVTVAFIAAAWKIVGSINFSAATPEMLREQMSQAFIETYNEIMENEKEQGRR